MGSSANGGSPFHKRSGPTNPDEKTEVFLVNPRSAQEAAKNLTALGVRLIMGPEGNEGLFVRFSGPLALSE